MDAPYTQISLSAAPSDDLSLNLESQSLFTTDDDRPERPITPRVGRPSLKIPCLEEISSIDRYTSGIGIPKGKRAKVAGNDGRFAFRGHDELSITGPPSSVISK